MNPEQEFGLTVTVVPTYNTTIREIMPIAQQTLQWLQPEAILRKVLILGTNLLYQSENRCMIMAEDPRNPLLQ